MIKLITCLQCGSGPVDEIRISINNVPNQKRYECQWCGRLFDQDEVDYFYFEESAKYEGYKLLANYACENHAQPDYLKQLAALREKQKEYLRKYFKFSEGNE